MEGVALEAEEIPDYQEVKEREYDKLAELIRGSVDMEAIYAMLEEAAV